MFTLLLDYENMPNAQHAVHWNGIESSSWLLKTYWMDETIRR